MRAPSLYAVPFQEAFIRKTRAVILGHPAAKKQQLLRWLQPADLPHVLSMVWKALQLQHEDASEMLTAYTVK
jgi:hypothetical protein